MNRSQQLIALSIVAVWILFAPRSYATIGIDATSTTDVANQTSSTLSHTVSGSNRLFLVGVETYITTTGGSVPSATWNGVPMSLVATQSFGVHAENDERISLFKLIAPDTGTHNIVVTASTTQTEITVGAISFTGVNQTTPLGTPTSTAPDNILSVSQTVPSTADELVFDVVSWYNQAAITVGAGQTQQLLNDNGGGNDSMAMSTEPGAATVTMSWDWISIETPGQIVVAVKPVAAATADQSAFLFRNDDGSESGATSLVSENATATQLAGVNTRLRVQVNTSGTAAAASYRLEYNKNGGSWLVASSTTSTAQVVPTFTAGTAASGTGAVTPLMPSVQANDIVFLMVASQNQASTTPPNADWTLVTSTSAGSGISTSTAMDLFWLRATSTSVTNPLVTDRGNVTIANVYVIRGASTTGNPWTDYKITNSTGNVTGLEFNGPTSTSNNNLILTFVADSFDNASARYSSWANPRLVSITEGNDVGTALGTGAGIGVAYGELALAGGVGTTTVTTAASAGQRGFSALVMAINPSAAPALPDLIVSPSANVNALAVSTTTAQLTAPAGKATSTHFFAGRISDDTNPMPSLTVTPSYYTELEWSLMATSTATTGNVFNFRVTDNGTVLDTYSQTPSWIIGTPESGGGVTVGPAPSSSKVSVWGQWGSLYIMGGSTIFK